MFSLVFASIIFRLEEKAPSSILAYVGESSHLESVREEVLVRLLRVFAVTLAAGVVIAAPFFIAHQRKESVLLGLGVCVLYSVLGYVRLKYKVRAWAFVACMAVGASAVTLAEGLDIGPAMADLVLPFLAVLFIGARAAIVAAVWCVATNVAVAQLELKGLIVIPPNPTAMRMDPHFWPMLILAQAFTGGPVIYIAHRLVSRLGRALHKEQQSLAHLQQLNETIAASERLKTLGLLAGGIAHDLNNTLTVIAGEVELADGISAEARESILHATTSASQLARQVLLSAGSALAQVRPIDLHTSIRPSLKALVRVMPENVKVGLPAPPERQLVVKADPVILQQALLNLAINARDAMLEGGELSISLDVVERQSRQCAVLIVADSGQGMSPDTLTHAVEPFFTTKERGRGTGLGLSNVKTAMNEFGGELEITSVQGVGTTVKLWMPLLEREQLHDSEPGELSTGDGKHLLLVEDNLRVRAIAFEILQRAGYHVFEAAGIASATAILDRLQSLDGLVCDLVLADGSGLELAREARARFPRSAIVITSGYVPQPSAREALARHEFRYLPKPFGAVALTKAIGEAIAAARPKPGKEVSASNA